MYDVTAVDGQARPELLNEVDARRRRDEIHPPLPSRRRFIALGTAGAAAAAALIALLAAGVFASSPAAGAGISESSIAGASLGQRARAYEHLFGKKQGNGIETQTHFPYLTWYRRKIAIYFGPAGGGAILIDTWNKAYRTAAGVGPCTSFARLKKVYGKRLKPSRWNKAKGKYTCVHAR